MKTDSLLKRYLSKLTSNSFNALLGAVSLLLVPRSLGAYNFGNFNYLTDFFLKLVWFFNLNTSLAFFTNLSKRNSDIKLIRFYYLFIIFSFFLSLGFIIVIIFSGNRNIVWPNQTHTYIYIAFIFAFLTFHLDILRKINDALGLTVKSEKWLVAQKTLAALLIVGLFYFNYLTLFTFYVHHFLILTLLITVWLFNLHKEQIRPFNNGYKLNSFDYKQYFNQFYKFSKPLFKYSLVGLICGLGERWLLQYYSGSIEQGYYGLAFKVGAFIFIFTESITQLFIREFSIASENNDIVKMQKIFHSIVPKFYFIATFLGLYFFINGNYLVLLIGGEEYSGAVSTFMIMSLYPIHQTYGQLVASVFYATGRTRLYSNIGITMMLAGLISTYFLIAPHSMFGLNLASKGLAYKMVLIQFIGVNIQLWFNSRQLDLSFNRYLLHQILIFTLLGIFAICSNFLVIKFFSNYILVLLFTGLLYLFITMLSVLTFPALIFMKKSELIDFYIKVKIKILKINR